MTKKEKYHLSKDCFCEDIDDSLFLLQSKTGQYHELNETGRCIIKMLDNKELTFNEILEKIHASKYKLKEKTLIDFINQLVEEYPDKEVITICVSKIN